MAFTDALNVTVGDPTKASDYNNLADNTEFNREKANAEHDFDITTGDGSHKAITADSTNIATADANTLGLLVRNLTFSSGGNDGLQFFIGDTGTAQIRSYEQSVTTYKPMQFSASAYTFLGQETDTTIATFKSSVTNCDVILQDLTTVGASVRVRATGNNMSLWAGNDEVITLSGAFVGINDTSPSAVFEAADSNKVAAGYTVGTFRQDDSAVVGLSVINGTYSQDVRDGIGLLVSNAGVATIRSRRISATAAWLDLDLQGKKTALWAEGASVASVTGSSTNSQMDIESRDLGAGNRAPALLIGRNSNATTRAPAVLGLHKFGGGLYYIWVGNDNKLRLGTTVPTELNDTTTGTIVGTQS